MCSLIHVAHMVLVHVIRVGEGGVIVVHIGHDEVLVVVQLRSHFCRDFLYQEMYSLQPKGSSLSNSSQVLILL